jgi:phosphoglycerol transferase MdoB-like AlkP superfamily enzyme
VTRALAGLHPLDLSAIAITVVCVALKLTYLTALAPSQWWSNEPTFGQWMRPADPLVAALASTPNVMPATAAAVLILVSPLAVLPRHGLFIGLWLVNVGLTFLGIANLVHVRFYGDVLSWSSFTSMRMIQDVSPSIPYIVRTTDPLLATDVAIAAIAGPLLLMLAGGRARATRGRRWIAAGLLVVGILGIVPSAARAWSPTSPALGPSTPRIDAAATLGLLPYHLLDTLDRFIVRRSAGPEMLERARGAIGGDRSTSPLAGVARGASVVLISAESLQAFPLDLEIGGRAVMPRLRALAAESLNFTNYFEQTHLGTTSDAQFSVLNGLHPQPVGFVAMNFVDNDWRAMPAILHEHGYTTVAAVAASSEFWNADRLNPRYGIHTLLSEESFQIEEMLGPWLADQHFFDQLLPRMAGLPRPFFLHAFSSTNHHPYDLPPHLRSLDVGAIDGTLSAKYLHTAHYFDAAIGHFVDGLRANGLLDEIVLVIYGDHQGFLGDPPELAGLLGLPAWDEPHRFSTRKRVPFLIRLPGGRHAATHSQPAGHLDVAPTLLSLLGHAAVPTAMLGRDLTTGGSGLVVFRDGSFVDDRHLFIHRVGASEQAGCYERSSLRQISCELVDPQRRRAREQLEVSDLIVQGNLVPRLLSR